MSSLAAMGEPTDRSTAPAQAGARLEDPVRALEEQLRAVRAIGAALATKVGVDALFEEIVSNVSALMHAERSTLFLYDSESRTIWSKIAQGETDLVIRLEVGQGIAGWVAENRQSVNIPDAYKDDRFNPEVDAETGFRTRSVAAVPLLDRDRNLLGVLQTLNHRGGAIGEEDMGLLEAIGVQCAYAVENAHLAQKLLDQNRELTRARDEANSANLTKSAFLANISHEIRTPMSGLLGLLDLVLDTSLEDDQREHLLLARSSADALLALMNDLLDFSKIEANRLVLDEIPFNLHDTMEDTIRMLRVQAREKGLGIAHHVASGVPDEVVGDPGRLRQIMLNLGQNAIKFSRDQDVTITIEVQERKGDELLLHVAVHDRGIGIAKDEQRSVFDAFSQADASTTRRVGGTGLGLAISEKLVAQMGGRMWLESEVGKGSTFHFTARLRVQETAVAMTRPQSSRPVGIRVLAVHDQPRGAQYLVEQLSRWRMAPVAVYDTEATITTLRTEAAAGKPISLVVIDAGSASFDAFELAGKIRALDIFPAARVIVCSALGQLGDGSRARDAGIAAYLTRPTTSSDLLDAINTVLPLADLTSVLVTKHTLRQNRHRFRVLVAEDNPVNRKLAQRLLEKRGHEVTTAEDGAGAIAAFEQTEVDVILMDVQMPEVDGIEATARIREIERTRRIHVPIIAVTANAIKGDRARYIDAGMDAYIAKPFVAGELYNLVETLGTAARTDICVGDGFQVSDLLDWAAACDRLGGDEEFLTEMIGDFAADIPTILDQLWRHFEAENAPEVHEAAHSLKGGAAIIGLTRVSTEAHRIEIAASRGDLASVTPAFWRIQYELSRLHTAVKAASS